MAAARRSRSRTGPSVLAALVACCGSVASGWAQPDPAAPSQSAAPPSLHFSLGGQDDLPGGTWALGRRVAAYEIAYQQPHVIGRLGLELSYLNEGHVSVAWPWYWPLPTPLHYRDSYAVQFDHWSQPFNRCRLGAAAGPQLYFDTTTSGYRTHYADRHSFGLRTSVSGQCDLLPTLAIEITAARSFDIADYDASVLMLGLSYTPLFTAEAHSEDSSAVAAPDYITLAGGTATVDSLRVDQEQGLSEWLTYGHHAIGPLGLQFSALDESVPIYLQRRAVAAQLVAAHTFGARWLRLFAGVGPELAMTDALVNGPCDGYAPFCDQGTVHRHTQFNVLICYGASIALGSRMLLLVKIGRVTSSSSTADTDLVTAGFGVRLH